METLHDARFYESLPGSEVLCAFCPPVWRPGRLPMLEEVRDHAARNLCQLLGLLAMLEDDRHYPVEISPALHQLADAADRELGIT